MARIVIRCQYTGHYIFTGADSADAPESGGHVFCPYCAAEHVWSGRDARLDGDGRPAPAVRHAG